MRGSFLDEFAKFGHPRGRVPRGSTPMRLMALQFLDFEGLGGRSLERCLAAVFAVADHDHPRTPRDLPRQPSAGRLIKLAQFELY